MIYKNKIELETLTDVKDFTEIVSKLDADVKLVDGEDMCINAKSILGALATIEWKSLYCISDKDIETSIHKYCA